ncbi:TlpA disulfide reductase family protein [Spirochaetia bacterium 38H-sp]|uniref:TlpA disulfide reductase family protein n=1 Tax=Rarispira pelagica TaxID=3141764 RepID=A0ABU9UCV8_9SPIR
MKKLFFIIFAVFLIFSCSSEDKNTDSQDNKSKVAEEIQDVLNITKVSKDTSLEDYLKNAGFATPDKPVKAPDFIVKALDGKDVSLSDYEGKVVFLNFWATWCPPCRMEMPWIETMVQKIKGHDVVFLAINVQEDKDTVKAFIEENNYTFPVLLDTSGTVSGIYGVSGIPTTYFIDKKGMVRGRLVGAHNWDSDPIYKIIKKALEE